MVEKPKHSKWQITLKVDRGNGKAYTAQISARSTKLFIYVTFVAALWTTSAYVFFYLNEDSEVQTMKALEYLNEFAELKEAEEPTPSSTKPEVAEPEPIVETKDTTLAVQQTTEPGEAEFALEDTAINVAAKTATVQMSLRKTSRQPEIEGKLAGILVLRDSATGSEYLISSRPGAIPLQPERADVEARGLYFRAKHRVQKQLVFNLPENTVFDEVKAELTVVTKDGSIKTLEVRSNQNAAEKQLKIGNSGVPAPNIH